MASEFLKRKAEERAKVIDQKYGKGAYGSTADLNKKRAEAKKATSKSSSTKSGGAKTEKSQASSVGSKVGSILGKTTPSVGLPISSSTKKTTDFNSESQNVYKNVKNKTTAKTTTTSNLTEKQRKARIKDIDAELKNLNIKLGGYSRAKAYGTSKAMEAEEQKVKDRISELSKEKKTLQRTGTFTAAELKQFEIDDAKAKKSALPTYNPTARVAPSGVEAYKKNIAAHSALDKEIDTLERQKELYDDINDFSEVVHKEDSGKGLGAWVNNFDSQWRANYRSNELSREADKAMAKYLADPTEENKEIAYAYAAFANEYAKNNKSALDDKNVKASWLTKSLAGYLPQLKDQVVPELVGGGLGGLLGSAVGAPNVGASIGAGIGTYSQSYDVMRGSVYRTLLAEGVDEDVALQASEDEALISSLIEGGETALSWLLMGGGKAISAVVGAAKSSVAKGSTSAATKFIANMATKQAAKKAVSTATTPLWKTGMKTVLGIGVDALGEYGEEFSQQGVSIANKERALRGETGLGNLVSNTGSLMWDVARGKNPEALAEMHEAGTEGFKIGLMMGGSKVVTRNVVSHYANAKTVKNQNEILDTIINDDETLTALIKEGKASGEGTVSDKIAKEVEQAKSEGKVTRNLIKSLIAANEVYIQEEAKYNADPLELAAMEVVNSETKQTTPTTVKSIKKATGFGDEGAKLVSTLMDSEGLTLEQAEGVVKTAYVAGTTNVEKAKVSFATPVQEQAFNAGKTDRIMDDDIAKAKAKKATVYEGSFTENEYTKNFSDAQKKMISIVSKDFGMDSSVVDKIIADKVTGAEANASHVDGVMQISSTAEQVIHELVLHESGHRMKQLAPTEFGVLMDALYERSMRNNQRAGIPLATNYDYIKAQHNNAGITLSTGGYLEEFAVRELETIFESAEEFNNWVSEIDSNPQVKSAWRKFVDWIAQIVEDIKRAISQRNMTKEERAEANRQLAELEHIKELYADAYKAARGVVSERKTVQKPEAKKGTTSKAQNLSKERQASDNTVSEEGEITNRTKKVLSGEKAVGVADGQAYVSDGKVFIPVNNVNVAKAELGATESKKVGENISKLLTKSDFTPINENYVDGNLEGVGAVRLFTDEKGREIALKKEIAEYFEGYNLEATFRGGKPYAIKATDNNGNVVGVAMAVWISTSGQKYKITDVKGAATKNTKNKTGATERATTNKEIAPNKKSEPQTKTEGIKEGDIFVAKKAGTTYKILSRDDRDTIVEITSAEGTKRTIISNEIADRNFINMSDEGITEWIDENLHIDNRTWEDVGSRQVKAFQYLFPEMREYYMPLARELLSDLSNTIKGERLQIGTYEQGDQEWIGVSRMTSDAIARIKDTTNASYDEIQNALERLINDNGQENIALAKRIELVFDDMLTDGYKTFEGEKIPPNEEYITKKEALIGKTYEGKNAEGDSDWWEGLDLSLKDIRKGEFSATIDEGLNGTPKYSIKVQNKKTIDFLENQEHITTYKAMQLIDGKLYPPMAAKTKGADGKYRLTNASELGAWQRAVEDPSNIKFNDKGVGYYVLNKGDGSSVTAAYNPYEHSSNLVLNDQFEGAYKRDNLVTVECVIPKSEMTSGYKARHAKDATGVLDWKSGVVAGKIKNNKRKVYLSRWLKPVRILTDAETAKMYKDALGDSNVSVPFNVVTPSLLSELEKIGVLIDYEGSPLYKSNQERNKGKKNYSLADTNSTKNLEIKINEEYNGNVSYSLKWHTDLSKAEAIQVVKWLRKAGSPENTKITDTANWYKGRINGRPLFVIYSTVYSNDPTIMYEISGTNALDELDILFKTMEVMDSERSSVEKSRIVNELLEGNWVQQKHNMANNNAGPGGRGSNIGYASVLQGKSSKFIGSRAFRNVVKNIYDIQEQDGQSSYSLKNNEYLELAKNPKQNEARLRALVDEAAEKAFPNSKLRGSDGKLRIV